MILQLGKTHQFIFFFVRFHLSYVKSSLHHLGITNKMKLFVCFVCFSNPTSPIPVPKLEGNSLFLSFTFLNKIWNLNLYSLQAPLQFEIKNTQLIGWFCCHTLIISSVNYVSVYYWNLRMKRSLIKLSRLVEYVTKMVTGCLRTKKVAIFFVWD